MSLLIGRKQCGVRVIGILIHIAVEAATEAADNLIAAVIQAVVSNHIQTSIPFNLDSSIHQRSSPRVEDLAIRTLEAPRVDYLETVAQVARKEGVVEV